MQRFAQPLKYNIGYITHLHGIVKILYPELVLN